jgi:DNA modification methylase
MTPITVGDATLFHGDCIEVMRSMPDNSVDAIVTDPPYGLEFMGKEWDAPWKGDVRQPGDENYTGSESRHNNFVRYGMSAGYGGDLAAKMQGFQAWCETWAREALRVLKPGGHMLAFSGSRTYHRMTCAIEDAGFEIRDQIMWVYGSGFPKSLDVSKAIDKAGGLSPADQATILRRKREAVGLSREQVAKHVDCTVSSVRDWEEGRARATGASVEFIVPSEDYRAKLADLLGYSADERRVIGVTADRRDDGTVYGVGHSGVLRVGGATDAARQWDGWGTALKPAHEPICVARKPLQGTVAANVLAHGTGALNIDGCRVTTDTPRPAREGDRRLENNTYAAGLGGSRAVEDTMLGRWPANLIHDGSPEVVALFPAQAGAAAPVHKRNGDKFRNSYGAFAGNIDEQGSTFHSDKGSAARFFYCPKATRKDRNEGCEAMEKKPLLWSSGTQNPGSFQAEGTDKSSQNFHPTVKPTDLMAYLVRLVTPPGGVVYDPFMGSGSTGKACAREGMRFIGSELSAEYLQIAVVRVAYEQKRVRVAREQASVPSPQMDLFSAGSQPDHAEVSEAA